MGTKLYMKLFDGRQLLTKSIKIPQQMRLTLTWSYNHDGYLQTKHKICFCIHCVVVDLFLAIMIQ